MGRGSETLRSNLDPRTGLVGANCSWCHICGGRNSQYKLAKCGKWLANLVLSFIGTFPILILYGVSILTPLHIFVYRYRLVAIPGIALCWAFLVSIIDSRTIRLLFCLSVVAFVTIQYHSSPFYKLHGYTWKYALEYIQTTAATDNAPVLMCSDLPEADHMPMPLGDAVKDSALFAPLSYYTLTSPVVALPRALNDDAVRIGSSFLLNAAQHHQRFLAVANGPSIGTLHWLADHASTTHYVRPLGTSQGITVLEFIPRSPEGQPE